MHIRKAAIVAFLPLVVLLAWVLRLQFFGAYGATITLPVRAYDPRDLLSGHYLTYQVEYGKNLCSFSSKSDPYCLCFSGSGPAKIIWDGYCSMRPSNTCNAYLRGECKNSGFIAGIERFYIPEVIAKAVPRIPNGSSIEVQLDPLGKGVVKNFFVNGVLLSDFAAGQVGGESRDGG